MLALAARSLALGSSPLEEWIASIELQVPDVDIPISIPRIGSGHVNITDLVCSNLTLTSIASTRSAGAPALAIAVLEPTLRCEGGWAIGPQLYGTVRVQSGGETARLGQRTHRSESSERTSYASPKASPVVGNPGGERSV